MCLARKFTFILLVVKIPLLKKIKSLIWPVILEKRSSEFNPVLEITLFGGKVMLNSRNANYSRGALHDVMLKALKLVKKDFDCPMQNVLMLGYGGGSAADIIRKHYNTTARISAVEIDPEVISIAKQWFPVSDVNLIQADACEFVKSDTGKYDLIIADIFIDINMPHFSIEKEFYADVARRLAPGGVFIQNLMISKSNILQQLQTLGTLMKDAGIARVFGANWLLFGRM